MSAAPDRPSRLRDVVDVRSHPTVVRLDDLNAGDAAWISESYLFTREVRAHFDALRVALSRPEGSGAFVIGQYGAGKSHFLAYLSQLLRGGEWIEEAPAVAPISLLNSRADFALEDIVSGALGIGAGGLDRRVEWEGLAGRHPRGLVLLIDELSEFLRSKPQTRSLNEDVRYLQYLGEWAQGRRFWVIAAMQESIEHTGELETGLYRKIKDRFPLRFLLGPTHVRDLIAGSILVKRPGHEKLAEEVASQLREAFPDLAIDYEALRALYPIHPATLELLEEVRDRFSQTRGVVDFAVTQLAGDSSRGIDAFLDSPPGSLLTPDSIVDHFRDLLEIQPEFMPLAQQFFPYYDRHLGQLFEKEGPRSLAARILKLLALVYLSPSRDGLRVEDAVAWLLHGVTRLDTDRNVRVVETVLRRLAEAGRYVVTREGQYRLDLRHEGDVVLEKALAREKNDLQSSSGERLFEALAPLLPADGFHPFSLVADEWQARSYRWHFHDRPYSLWIGDLAPPERDGLRLCLRLPWGTRESVSGAFTVLPEVLETGADLLELAALGRVRERPWSEDIERRIEARLTERLGVFASQLRSAYLNARIVGPRGESLTPPRIDPESRFGAWLDGLVEWALQLTYPAFEKFAPSHGPLPHEAYRRFLRAAAEGEMGSADADRAVQLVREAYLVPMGLLERRGRQYVVPAKVESNELVRLLSSLLDSEPSPRVVYEHLAQPVYGLVADQVSCLLSLLVILGEIDIVKDGAKDGRSFRDGFETLPNPLGYDRIVAGQALGMEQLKALSLLFDGLHIRSPKQWTVLAQRRAVERIREAGRSRVESLQTLLVKLRSLGQGEALVARIEGVLAPWRILAQGGDELDSLRQFLQEIGAPRRYLAEFATLGELPPRVDRMLSEIERFRHLLAQPFHENLEDSKLEIRFESLGNPPGLESPEAVDGWIARAREVYREYCSMYRERHDAYWTRVREHAMWSWKPPALARSRHVGLEGDLERLQALAKKERCPGLSNLDFQPFCRCGFDGRGGPFDEVLKRFEAGRRSVQEALEAFFARDEVRGRLRRWLDEGLESTAETLAYVDGKTPLPRVSDLELLDRYLAGVDVVRQVKAAELWEAVSGKTWEREELLSALDDYLSRYAPARLRLPAGDPATVEKTGRPRPELTRWCLEQCLRNAVPLPQGSGLEPGDVVEAMRPDWIGPEALGRLEELGLPGLAVESVLRWIVEGRVQIAGESALSPLAAAAAQVIRPRDLQTPAELAALASNLYSAHPVLARSLRQDWLGRLDQLARAWPAKEPPSLMDLLREDEAAQWLVIDGLGLPLVERLGSELETVLKGWKIEGVDFACVSDHTTTDAWWSELLAAEFQHPLWKVNAVDRLLHERFVPLADLWRLAAAELALALRPIAAELDPSRPLLVFADHGFRIAADGSAYEHGGDSALERIVPVLRMRCGEAGSSDG